MPPTITTTKLSPHATKPKLTAATSDCTSGSGLVSVCLGVIASATDRAATLLVASGGELPQRGESRGES